MLRKKEIQAYLDNLTKPPGSLGLLEELAARLCVIQQTLRPRTRPRSLTIFAGDHGVVSEGVTAWPTEVTELMIDNILAGGAAGSVLARLTRTGLRLVDVGSLAPPRPESESYRYARVAAGTSNLARKPAMTKEQFEQAFAIGMEEAERSAYEGAAVVAAGEMGIGNSTPAACLASLLCGIPAEQAVGRGAGADDAALARKKAVVAAAVERAQPPLAFDPATAIASVCGFEIAAMAGFYHAAVEENLTIVLDGFIATAAALVAQTLYPGAAERMIAAHRSNEPGHGRMLEKLKLRPLLDWSMRLGEGTGALLAMPLLDAAAAIVEGMATFESTGITHG